MHFPINCVSHCTFCLWGVHMMDTFRVIMYVHQYTLNLFVIVHLQCPLCLVIVWLKYTLNVFMYINCILCICLCIFTLHLACDISCKLCMWIFKPAVPFVCHCVPLPTVHCACDSVIGCTLYIRLCTSWLYSLHGMWETLFELKKYDLKLKSKDVG